MKELIFVGGQIIWRLRLVRNVITGWNKDVKEFVPFSIIKKIMDKKVEEAKKKNLVSTQKLSAEKKTYDKEVLEDIAWLDGKTEEEIILEIRREMAKMGFKLMKIKDVTC